ncbi:MAG TPA: TauD/TfdA family dioxygenase [Pyrinomonadaceae bacterium]|nr:TauD/TfdA family dioxygenase [Pyrinomonadaceae bacterium]
MSTSSAAFSVDATSPQEVNLGFLRPNSPLPLVLRPGTRGLDLIEWAKSNAGFIDLTLLQHGAILFRGFGLAEVAEFERLIEELSGPLLNYSYRSTPRSLVSGKIYSSTEYPAHQSIPLHNENSYSRSWPMKLWFFSMLVAKQGGATPIADSRKIFKAISPEICDCFVRKGLMYVRNYGIGLDLPWQEVFQTSSKAVVEDFCQKSDMEFEWLADDQLRTRQVCQVVERHPRTGEMVWFNQAHLFHVSRLPLEVREWLLLALGEQNLPRNVYFADGSSIDAEMIDEIARVCDQHSIVFPWHEGDVLLLDNMLTAHGRKPFVGERKVVVGMAEPNQPVFTRAARHEILSNI